MKINLKKLRYEYDGKTTAVLLDRLRQFQRMATRNEEAQARHDTVKSILLRRGEL